MPEDRRDTEQLKLLVIFHYVLAGLGVLGLLFLLGHFMMMQTMLTVFTELPKNLPVVQGEPLVQGETPPIASYGNSPDEPEPEVTPSEPILTREVTEIPSNVMKSFFTGFIIFYLIGAVFILAMMILNVISAQKMGKRKGRIFSMVVAGLNCLSFPLGTALGVFTFVVLSRTSVEASYRKAAGL